MQRFALQQANSRVDFVATLGEFMGTTMFLFFAFAGTQVANIGAGSSSNNSTTNADTGFSPIVLLYISLSFGFSLMVNVWVFFRISGGLWVSTSRPTGATSLIAYRFNPAVTAAMLMVKGISLVRAILLIGAQLVGAICASFLVSVLFPVQFNVRTTLSKDTSVARGVFVSWSVPCASITIWLTAAQIEMILTAELIFTIYMLANEKHKATFMAPIGIGLTLFISEMVGVYYTGGSLNPARSFGPCVISGTWDNEHWIYCKLTGGSDRPIARLTARKGVGPGAGAVIAWGFYRFIKMLEYEMANPGQEAASDGEAAQETAELTPKKAEVV